MTDINNLAAQDEPVASDMIPIWSALAGGTRRITMRTLSLFIGADAAAAGATAGAAAALPQVFATYSALQAAITAGQFTAPRSVVVTTDETNDNTRTFYNWDGAALQWVPTVDA